MAVKQIGKKGVFLTFISIVIIAALIIIFTPSDLNLKKDISVVKTRVSKVDEYVFDLENVYLENTLKAIGRRTIIALIGYMEAKTIEAGEPIFLTNFENDFSQVLLDGTIEDPPIPIDDFIEPDIMTGKTYRDYLYANDAISIKKAAEKALNVQTEFDQITVSNIRVSQISPWFVDVEADINITISTVERTASWTRNVTIKTSIAIENFNDPYYLVKTGGSYKNVINKSGTKFDEWDINKVKDFIRNGNYTHFENSQAPSFIDRFTDNIAPSPCCGIESLVDPNKLDVPDRDKALSYLDYKFFPSWQSAPICDDVTTTLYTEESPGGINSEFSDIKFHFSDLIRFKIRDDPSADVQQICPPEE